MYSAALVQVVSRYCGVFDYFNMGWLARLFVVLDAVIY
jgi:hypothetical protein